MDQNGVVLHQKKITDGEITRFLPKNSILLVCDEEKYSRIVDYINNDNIYSFNDYLISKVSGVNLSVQEPVTIDAIIKSMDRIKDSLNDKMVNGDEAERKAKVVNNQTYSACYSLLHSLRKNGFLDIESSIDETANGTFERIMLEVSDIVPNVTNMVIADEMFRKVLDKPLARVLIRGINMTSVNIDDDEVVDQLLNHFIDEAGVRNILNSYLTK